MSVPRPIRCEGCDRRGVEIAESVIAGAYLCRDCLPQAQVTPTAGDENPRAQSPKGSLPSWSASRSRSRSRSSQVSAHTGDSGGQDVELARRVQAVERGLERPDFDVPLNIDRLPRNASALRALAERVAIVMALALSDGDTDPAPLSVGLVARLMGLDPQNRSHRGRAWRQRQALLRRKIIRSAGRLKPTREGWEGTDCFQPYDFDLAAVFEGGVDPHEVCDVAQKVGGLDPDVKVGNELSVDGAEVGVTPAGAVGEVAAARGARTFRHDADDNRGIGGQAARQVDRAPASDEADPATPTGAPGGHGQR